MILPDRVALGTMHGKEAAIAPPLGLLGMSLIVPPGLDTDAFGTFTGEISRRESMLDAARQKAQVACKMTGLDFGIGSEGSFGPNPAFPIVSMGREVLVFWDAVSGREIIEQVADQQPCFASCTVARYEDMHAMLARLDFPRTSLVVSPTNRTGIYRKGVSSVPGLQEAIAKMAAQSEDGRALVQTDMRANHNPRRMLTIGAAARQLAARLDRSCPRCGAFGWGLISVEKGLPCSSCGEPTELVRYELNGCTACHATDRIPRRDGLVEADPAHCQCCNP
jgi:hypothetical protein